MTGIVAAALSWFDTSGMPWTTLSCWFSGIFTGLASLGTSGQQALAFRSMKAALGYEDVLRTSLGTGTLDAQKNIVWEPNYAYIYLLQIPVMTIKVTFILFILGLEIGLWDAAMKKTFLWTAPEMKVSLFPLFKTLIQIMLTDCC
jgi:hypothetical protein